MSQKMTLRLPGISFFLAVHHVCCPGRNYEYIKNRDAVGEELKLWRSDVIALSLHVAINVYSFPNTAPMAQYLVQPKLEAMLVEETYNVLIANNATINAITFPIARVSALPDGIPNSLMYFNIYNLWQQM